jgi:hypothetical protein
MSSNLSQNHPDYTVVDVVFHDPNAKPHKPHTRLTGHLLLRSGSVGLIFSRFEDGLDKIGNGNGECGE